MAPFLVMRAASASGYVIVPITVPGVRSTDEVAYAVVATTQACKKLRWHVGNTTAEFWYSGFRLRRQSGKTAEKRQNPTTANLGKTTMAVWRSTHWVNTIYWVVAGVGVRIKSTT